MNYDFIVGLGFIREDKSNFTNNTTYYYGISEKQYNDVTQALQYSGNNVPLFTIRNTSGNNYRGSFVVVKNLFPSTVFVGKNVSVVLSEIRAVDSIVPSKSAYGNLREYRGQEVWRLYIGQYGSKSALSNQVSETPYMESNSAKEKIELYNKKEDNNSMNMNKMMPKFDFGPANDVIFSIYGPSFRDNENRYFAIKGDEYVDVTGMTFDFFGMCYKMPVAKTKVEMGDFILHDGSWTRIVDVDERGYLIVEKIFAKEVVTILPTKNMFGFDFYTKLVTFGGDMFGEANADNPFGNILPFMMMNQSGGAKDDILPIMLMMNQAKQNSTNSLGFDPMMLMLMSGNMNESSIKNMIFLSMLKK